MSRDLPPVIEVTLEAALLGVNLRRREIAAQMMRIHREHAFIHRYAGIPVSDAVPPFTDDEMRELRVIPTDRVEAILEQVLAAVSALSAVPAVAVPQRRTRRAYARGRAQDPGVGVRPEPAEEAAPVAEVPAEVPPSTAVQEAAVADARPPGPALLAEPALPAEEPSPPAIPPEAVAPPVEAIPAAPAERASPVADEGNAAQVAKAVAHILSGAAGKTVHFDGIHDMPTVLQKLHYKGESRRMQAMELREVLSRGVREGKWEADGQGYRTVVTNAGRRD